MLSSSCTWLMMPIMPLDLRTLSSTSIASWMELSSRVPKPSSMNRASICTPPLWATVDRPMDRARDTKNFSPPESMLTLLPWASGHRLSWTFNSSPRLLPFPLSSERNRWYRPSWTLASIRLASPMT